MYDYVPINIKNKSEKSILFEINSFYYMYLEIFMSKILL